MQTTKWELYEYQRSRSVIDLGPNHLHSIFLNFFSSVTADFNTSSAIRWAIQDQWSSGLKLPILKSTLLPQDYLTAWQNQQSECASREDSDKPGHLPSLIRVFAVRMKKPWALSYPLSTQWRLFRLGWCPSWSGSSLGAQSFCWFCHVAANLTSWPVVWTWTSNMSHRC